MLIVLGIYAGALYLVFGKWKLLRWNGFWKSVSALVGLIIALVVIGALNYQTPSGGVTVQGATVAITPNVSGTVVEIAVDANKPVKKGDLLFKIDPEPFQIEIDRLQAALVEAQTAADMLATDMQAVEAEIDGLNIQLAYGQQRRDDIVKLADRGVNSQFQLQEAVSTIGQLEASLRAAIARKQGLKLRIASQVNGVDSAVVQARESLQSAKWKLQQTEVHAPDDGIVTALTLNVGSRVTILNPALAFVPNRERVLVGVFSQASSHALDVGTPVSVAMRNQPGEFFEAVIDARVPGTGEGSLPVTGTLPTVSQLLGTRSVVVRLKVPDDQTEQISQLGATGTALVITPDAGAVEPLAKILFWVARYMNYL